MKIQPLHDRVLVRRVDSTELTKGMILIPETAREKPMEAIVVAAGKGKTTDTGAVLPLDVAPGDRILMGKYSGSEIEVDGETLVILREEEILALVEKA